VAFEGGDIELLGEDAARANALGWGMLCF
jgi:hypothetical protein